jgi:pilus assembly protein CpaB
MRLIFGLVLIVGLGLAGGAVYMARNYIGLYQSELAKERAARQPAIPTVQVLVANRALKYGEILSQQDVTAVEWPKGHLPEGVFHSLSDLFPDDSPGPRLMLRAVEGNEAILAIKVTKPGEDAGLTSRLERGMRAFAIKVDVASGVSGFLRPGDRVDVYWTGKVSDGSERKTRDVTKLIEAAVHLIAVDQSASDLDGATIARTVTVAVQPAQVAALAQAQSTGRLSLSLVGIGDDTVAAAIEVDQRSLLGLVDPPAPTPTPDKRKCSIKTRRGAEVMEIEIPCPDD